MKITFDELISKYNINVTGILHIGAHECEELQAYNNCGINNIYWVEAMDKKVKLMKDKGIENIFQAVIDEEDNKQLQFNITNNGQSSSILELGTHKRNHPEVHVSEVLNVTTTRLDTLIDRENIPIETINFINLDIQGVELRAMKSMEKYLKHIKYIYTEVNTEHVYKGCDLLSDIDNYLGLHGFTRVACIMHNRCGWGDAFYIKN